MPQTDSRERKSSPQSGDNSLARGDSQSAVALDAASRAPHFFFLSPSGPALMTGINFRADVCDVSTLYWSCGACRDVTMRRLGTWYCPRQEEVANGFTHRASRLVHVPPFEADNFRRTMRCPAFLIYLNPRALPKAGCTERIRGFRVKVQDARCVQNCARIRRGKDDHDTRIHEGRCA